jgi:hypothetical protein
MVQFLNGWAILGTHHLKTGPFLFRAVLDHAKQGFSGFE